MDLPQKWGFSTPFPRPPGSCYEVASLLLIIWKCHNLRKLADAGGMAVLALP